MVVTMAAKAVSSPLRWRRDMSSIRQIKKIPSAVRRENPDGYQDFLQKHAWGGEINIIL